MNDRVFYSLGGLYPGPHPVQKLCATDQKTVTSSCVDVHITHKDDCYVLMQVLGLSRVMLKVTPANFQVYASASMFSNKSLLSAKDLKDLSTRDPVQCARIVDLFKCSLRYVDAVETETAAAATTAQQAFAQRESHVDAASNSALNEIPRAGRNSATAADSAKHPNQPHAADERHPTFAQCAVGDSLYYHLHGLYYTDATFRRLDDEERDLVRITCVRVVVAEKTATGAMLQVPALSITLSVTRSHLQQYATESMPAYRTLLDDKFLCTQSVKNPVKFDRLVQLCVRSARFHSASVPDTTAGQVTVAGPNPSAKATVSEEFVDVPAGNCTPSASSSAIGTAVAIAPAELRTTNLGMLPGRSSDATNQRTFDAISLLTVDEEEQPHQQAVCGGAEQKSNSAAAVNGDKEQLVVTVVRLSVLKKEKGVEEEAQQQE